MGLPYGSEITIKPPTAVNMIVSESLDGKTPSKKRMQQLDRLRQISRQYGIDPRSHDIILPITLSMRKSSGSTGKIYTYCTGNILSPIAKVRVYDRFPFELAFAMTVHKAQGRTIRRVVIDLTEQPMHSCRMEYAAIFVAMSRVEDHRHIRLLERTSVGPRDSLYTYLDGISPDKHIAPFLSGYSTNGLPWDPDLALSYKKKKN